MTRAAVSPRTRWSDSADTPPLGPRLDDDTGRPISDADWARHEWIDVTTFGDLSPRFTRGRVR